MLPELSVVGDPEADERPDFFLTLANGRRVGLEIVRAINQGIARGRGTKIKLKKRVLADLIAEGVNAHVYISLTEGTGAMLAAESMRQQLAAEIKALVRLAKQGLADFEHVRAWRRYEWFNDIVDDTGYVCWRDPNRDRGMFDLEGTGIEFCNAVMVRPTNEPIVGCGGSGIGQPRHTIQEAIDAKLGSIDAYRQRKCDEIWLLVIGSAGTGGALDISDADGEFVSAYDRTFFLETFDRECVELSTVAPNPIS